MSEGGYPILKKYLYICIYVLDSDDDLSTEKPNNEKEFLSLTEIIGKILFSGIAKRTCK